MSTARQEIEDFHQFAIGMIGEGPPDLTFDDIVDSWRFRPSPEDIQAVQEALDAMDAGDTGEDADVVIARLRARHQQSSQ